MRAALRIQTRIRNEQALYRPVADNMGFDNLVHIGFCDSAVPDSIGIDNNIGAMLALVEAAGLIRADYALHSAPRQFDFKHALEVGFACRIAAAPWIGGRPLITTNEDVLLKLWHRTI